MANEITITCTAQVSNDNAKLSWIPGVLRIDQTNRGFYQQTIAVGTSETELVPSDMTAYGYVIIRNLDDATNVHLYAYGSSSGLGLAPFATLWAGEFAMFRHSDMPSVISCKSDAGECLVEVIFLEE